MRNVRLHPLATAEAEESAAFYEQRRVGFGDEFAAELERGLARVAERPALYRFVFPPYRSYRLVRFPFQVIYRVSDPDVFVVAVAHFSRHPDFWKDRV